MGKKTDNFENGDFSMHQQANAQCHVSASTYVYGDPMEFDPPSAPTQAEPGSGWQTVSAVTWIAVLSSLIAVTISSRTIGRPVWWIGPTVDPAPAYLMLIPIACVVIPLVATIRLPRRMAMIGCICSLLLMATAIPDFTASPAIAIAIFVIGIAALAESIALVLVTRHYR
jgi:hypothetical protein